MAADALAPILDIAATLGFPVPADYRAGVLENYARLLDQAALVMATQLPPELDEPSEFVP